MRRGLKYTIWMWLGLIGVEWLLGVWLGESPLAEPGLWWLNSIFLVLITILFIYGGIKEENVKFRGFESASAYDGYRKTPLHAVIVGRESRTEESGYGRAAAKYIVFGPAGLMGHRQRYDTRYYTTFEITYMDRSKRRVTVEDYGLEYEEYMKILVNEPHPITYTRR